MKVTLSVDDGNNLDDSWGGGKEGSEALRLTFRKTSPTSLHRVDPEHPALSRECGFPIGEKHRGRGSGQVGASALVSRAEDRLAQVECCW